MAYTAERSLYFYFKLIYVQLRSYTSWHTFSGLTGTVEDSGRGTASMSNAKVLYSSGESLK